MRKDYVDFVLCNHEGSEKNYLFYAPAFSGIQKGNQVVVDTKNGTKVVNVVSVATVPRDNLQFIDFIMNATGADNDVKKVISVIQYREMDYSEEEKLAVDTD